MRILPYLIAISLILTTSLSVFALYSSSLAGNETVLQAQRSVEYAPSVLSTKEVETRLGTNTTRFMSLNDSRIRIVGMSRNTCLDENCTRKASYVLNWCYQVKEDIEYCEIGGKGSLCRADGFCSNVSLLSA